MLLDDERFGWADRLTEPAPRPAPRSPQGLIDRAIRGAKSTFSAGRIAGTNDPATIADVISGDEKDRPEESDVQRRMREEIKPYVDEAAQADGMDAVLPWAKLAAVRLSQFARNPSEAFGMILENLPNSVPGMAGMVAGGMGGTAAAGPVGGIVGSVIGGTAGGYAVEQGASMREQILKEAAARGIDAKDPKALEPMIAEKYDEFLTNSRWKGAGTAGTDAVLTRLTLGIGGIGERAIASEARALALGMRAGKISGKDGALALARLTERDLANNTLLAKSLRGGAMVGGEMLGEAASEAVGQKLAYGKVDPLEVVDEGLLAIGQGGVMAAGRKVISPLVGAERNQVGEELDAARNTLRVREQLDAAEAARTTEALRNIESADTVEAAVSAAGAGIETIPFSQTDVDLGKIEGHFNAQRQAEEVARAQEAAGAIPYERVGIIDSAMQQSAAPAAELDRIRRDALAQQADAAVAESLAAEDASQALADRQAREVELRGGKQPANPAMRLALERVTLARMEALERAKALAGDSPVQPAEPAAAAPEAVAAPIQTPVQQEPGAAPVSAATAAAPAQETSIAAGKPGPAGFKPAGERIGALPEWAPVPTGWRKKWYAHEVAPRKWRMLGVKNSNPISPSFPTEAEAEAWADAESAAAAQAQSQPAPVDAAAHQAATSPKNDLPQPTEAQKEAGNYAKGHARVAGLDLSIENPAGSKRRREWPTLQQHYGYVKGSVGMDKDHLDVFVKPGTTPDWKGKVYVVNQKKGDGKPDEHKGLIGFDSLEAARAAYLENYTAGWEKNVDSIVPIRSDKFAAWAADKSKAGPAGGFLKSGSPGVQILGQSVHRMTERALKTIEAPLRKRADAGERLTPKQREQLSAASDELDRRAEERNARPLSDAEKARREKLKREAAARKKIDIEKDSIIPAIAKLGGLNVSQRMDTIRDSKGQRGVPGVGALFTKNGMEVDGMAIELAQYGYLTQAELDDVDGGAEALRQKVAEEFDGVRRHWSVNSSAPMREEAERQAEDAERLAAAEQEAAESLGAEIDFTITPEELAEDGITDDAESMVIAELVARAEAIRDGIGEDLARQHQTDAAFKAALVQFLKEHEDAAVGKSPQDRQVRREEGEGSGVPEGDRAPAQAGAEGEGEAKPAEVVAARAGDAAGAKPSEAKLYEYGLTLRPASSFTVPKGFVALGKNEKYPHGTVSYAKPLSRADVEHFDLAPLDPADPINVKSRLEKRREALLNEFAGSGTLLGVYRNTASGNRLVLTESAREGVQFQVTTMYGGTPTGHRDYNDFDDAAREFTAGVAVRGIDDDFAVLEARANEAAAALPVQPEDRPALSLDTQTEADLDAKDARAADESVAERAIADRERDLFQLQPQETAAETRDTTGDMFDATGATQQPKKRADVPAGTGGGLFAAPALSDARPESKFHIKTQGEDGSFEDLGEGPFDSRAEAEAFAEAEVGVPYEIVETRVEVVGQPAIENAADGAATSTAVSERGRTIDAEATSERKALQNPMSAAADALIAAANAMKAAVQPVEKAELDPRKGDRFTDADGKTWEVWNQRGGRVEAFPVIDGKMKVNNRDGQFWSVTASAKERFPDARTDFNPVAKKKAEPTPQVASPGQLKTFIGIAADSIKDLRKVDVERVLTSNPRIYQASIAAHIKERRPDLAQEVDDVLAEQGPSTPQAPARSDAADRPQMELGAGERINAAIDDLVNAIETKETDRGVAMYQPQTAYNPVQLDLIYDDAETRPGTTDEQRSEGIAALRALYRRDRRAGATVLGSNLWRDFVARKGADLIGQQAGSPQELGLLAQILRDPRFETLRFFFVKGGVIVGHSGVTSRLPGSVAFSARRPGPSTEASMQAEFDGRIDELRAMMQNLGADGYYMLHNHPSGASQPSYADEAITKKTARSMDGFKGHVIINSKTFDVISGRGDVNSFPVTNEPQQPELAHDALGMKIAKPSDVMEAAKLIQRKDGYATLITATSRGNVQAIAEIPEHQLSGATERDRLKAMVRVRRFAKMTGSGMGVFVVTDNMDAKAFLIENGVVTDVIQPGKAVSLRDTVFPRLDMQYKAGALRAEQMVWHGSPHDFDEFSLDKIGTGEGAQAYGWGLYFAGKKAVAEHYKRSLGSGKFVDVGGRRIGLNFNDERSKIERDAALNLLDADGDFEKARARAQTSYYKPAPIVNAINQLESAGATIKESGRLYQVDLAPKKDEYLDWDRPLDDQPQTKNLLVGDGTSPLSGWLRNSVAEAWTGETVYRALSGHFGNDRAASEYLNRKGIPGIRYLDGGSRSQSYKAEWAAGSDMAGSQQAGAYLKYASEAFSTHLGNKDKAAGLLRSQSNELRTRGSRYGEADIRERAAGMIERGELVPSAVGDHNYVVFDDKLAKVEAKFSRAKPVSYTTTKDGRPVLAGNGVEITDPAYWQKAFGSKVYTSKIVDPEAGHVGFVTLGWRDGRVAQLLHIEVAEEHRGKGYAERAVRSILQHNGGAELHVMTILPEARGFWMKLGTDPFDTETGEDGILTEAAYDVARNGEGAARQGGEDALRQDAQRGDAGESQAPAGFRRDQGQALGDDGGPLPGGVDPRVSGAASDGIDGKAASVESHVDRIRFHAEALRDFLDGNPLSNKPFRSLDAKTQRFVLSHVLGVTHDPKILRAIVESIPVDVVNILRAQQLSPERFLRNESMLKDALFIDSESPVAVHHVANTLLGNIARVAAKRVRAADVVALTSEGRATTGTREVDDRHAAILAATSRVQAIVDRLRAQWERAPIIKVLGTMEDAPAEVRGADERAKSLGATGSPEGFIYRGVVYLVADMLPTDSAVVRVAAHEVLGHAGLRGVFGNGLDAVLDDVTKAMPSKVREKAKQYGLDYANTDERLMAAEEVLAELAQTRPQAGLVKRAIAAIRRFLRDLGIDLKLSDNDLIVNFILPARAFVEGRGEGAAAGVPAPAFGRDAGDIAASRERALGGMPMFSRAAGNAASWDSPMPSRMDSIIYAMQDKQIDTRRVLEQIRKHGSVADAQDVRLQEELYHGRTAKQVDDFLAQELKPLVTEMAARKVTMAEFEEYLHARHAEERNAQIAKINPEMPDGGSGMDTADARAYLSGLDPAKKRAYEALAKRVDAINAKTRQALVDYGLESQDTVDAWEQAYQHYVPLQREDMEGGPGTGQGFSVRGPASKRATGSSRSVVDILANIAAQREKAIVRGEKNRVAVALVGLAESNPNADFWRVDDPPRIKYVDDRTGLVTSAIDPLYKSRENVVMARVPAAGGEIVERSVIFNEHDERAMRMAAALKNLDMDDLGVVLGMSAKVTRYFAAVNTQYNPVFGVVNLMRDFQGAMVNLSSTELAGKQAEVSKNTLSALRGIYIDTRDTRQGKPATSAWAQLWEEFQTVGGKTGYRDMFRTSKDRGEAIEREIARVSEGKAKQFGRAVFDWLSDYNTAMENAVRLSAYKAGLDSGMTQERAASLAKNLTVNFNRKGQVATQAGALYAFFNASVQGTARLAETLAGPAGRKIIGAGMTLGVLQALLLAAAGFDDNEPPEFVRERNLIIPIGDKKYITIPMPLGLHVLPNVTRIASEFALSGFRDPGKRVAQLAGVFAEAFNPIGNAGLSLQTIAPTAIDPLAALAENRDWTGKPIAREDMNKLAPTPGHTRAKDVASAFSKAVSKGLNWMTGGTNYKPGFFSPTPDQIDYLIGQATGGVGREAMKAEQTITSAFTGDDLPTHKVPLLGRLYGNAEQQSSHANAFYANLKLLNEHEAEIKGRKKAGEPIGDYFQANPEARLFQLGNQYERRVSELRKMKRGLAERDAPADQIKAIDERIRAQMKVLNDRVKQVREMRP